MNKLLLSALGVAAIALFVWALMPAEQAPVDGPTTAPAPAAKADTPKAGAPSAEVDPRAAARPRAAADTPQPKRHEPPSAPPPNIDQPKRVQRPQLLPPLMPLPEGEMKSPDESRWGRKGQGSMPVVEPAAVKSSVRQYYGNLPRSGRMPGRINIEEVFPPAVYEGLNVPPDSQLVEIGPHPASTPEGLAEILEAPDGQNIIGLTVVTPDGERVRDYIQLGTETDAP